MSVAAARAAARESRAAAIPLGVSKLRPRVVWALARTETRKLLLHPAFLAVVALAIFQPLTSGMIFADGAGGPNSGRVLIGVGLGLFVGTLLATNLAALRTRRDGMAELFGSTASSRENMTVAHLTSVLMGPCAIAVLISLGAFFLRLDGKILISIDPTLPAQFVLVVFAFGSLGVALARWIPSVLAAPVVIVAQMFTPLVWLVPWIVVNEWDFHMGWHFAWLLATITFFASSAFVRDRATAIRIAVAAGSLALAIASGVLQLPPDEIGIP